MKAFALTLWAAGTLSLRSAPLPGQQHWLPLADIAGSKVDIDTQRVARQPNGTVILSLRWRDFGGASGGFSTDRVQRREVNCLNHTVRVLETREFDVTEGLVSHRDTGRVVLPDATWHGYPSGSFGAGVLGRVCTWLRTQHTR